MINSQDMVFWILAAVQAFGVASCLLARLSEATAHAVPCRQIFVLSLVSVGAAMVAAFYCGSHCWVSCGATFSLICLGATIDHRGQFEPSAF